MESIQLTKDKINSLDDFKKYWSPEALGENFVPKDEDGEEY